MEAWEVISEVLKAGATIQNSGRQIEVMPMSFIEPELRQQIARHRGAIWEILQAALFDLVQLTIEKAWILYEQRIADTEVMRVIGDTSGLANSTQTEIDGWACALALRTLQARQKVPKGWEKVANCKRCGPVWAEHELTTLSCGWCWMRAEGLTFPQPEDKP